MLVISLVICKTTEYVLMNLTVRTCPKSCLQYLFIVCMSLPLLILYLKYKLNLYQFSESDSLCINLCLTKYGAHYILQLNLKLVSRYSALFVKNKGNYFVSLYCSVGLSEMYCVMSNGN